MVPYRAVRSFEKLKHPSMLVDFGLGELMVEVKRRLDPHTKRFRVRAFRGSHNSRLLVQLCYRAPQRDFKLIFVIIRALRFIIPVNHRQYIPSCHRVLHCLVHLILHD